MNNEPVAWIVMDVDNGKSLQFKENKFAEVNIPLYTHPVKYCPSENNEAYEKGFIDGMAKMIESAVHRAVEGMAVKELTDEEILEIASPMFEDARYPSTALDFARAILIKAQEK